MFSSFHLITCFLLLSKLSSASISFNFPNITQQNENRDIIIQGNGASVSDGGIQLTRNMSGSDLSLNMGRATYIRPLHLWDTQSRSLATFSTNFTFVIDSIGSRSYGDGLTFFLADNNSVISEGGAMGLPFNITPDLAAKRFAAVEFDTYWNPDWDPVVGRGDPMGDHVGIDISSVTSVASQKWFSNVTGGGVCQAWIKYDSVSKNLSVEFTGFENNMVVRQDGLVYTVDLRVELPEWVIIGFSGATENMFQRNTIRSWSFESSDLVLVKVKNNKVGLIVGITVGITCVVVLVFVLWRRMRKKTKMKSREDVSEEIGFVVEMDNEFEIGTRPKHFTYLELAESTSDFAENNKLGEGGFSWVYKCFLKDLNTYVAVKRVSSKERIKDYTSEVRIITQLRHKNLVQLTGWCHEKGELLLVYEYMENGSLDSHLFKGRSLLTWSTRYKIANGLASALWYLHEGWEKCVLHKDVTSSKVLLDSNFNAKLSDFGLAVLVDHEKESEITMACKATKESDIFSFGVVALELASGKNLSECTTQEKQIPSMEWIWELYRNDKLIEVADQLLGSDFVVDEIMRLVITGLWCVHPHSELRPSMRQVIQILNSQASVPLLPSTILASPNIMSPIS